MEKLIKNGKVVIPKLGIVNLTIGINEGKIAALFDPDQEIIAEEEIDASGRYIIPGVIDAHTHWGYTAGYRKQCEAESQSAAIGGVTTALVHLMSDKPYDDEYFNRCVNGGEEASYIDFGLQFMITNQDHPACIEKAVRDWGISSFKFLMGYKGAVDQTSGRVSELNDGIMYESFAEIAKFRHAIACVHAENAEIASHFLQKIRASGMDGLRAWEAASPGVAEAENTLRSCYFAETTGCPVYIVHLSSKEALRELARFKSRYDRVYGETTPHYLVHNVDSPIGNLGKIGPPLRTKEENDLYWQALADGAIDCVGSDTTPTTRELKKGDIWGAARGFPGTGTLLPLLLSEGVNKGRISLERVVELVSYNPARIFNLYPRKGAISVGSDADLTVIDLDMEKTVTAALMQSWSEYSVYEGWKLKGWPVMTLIRGEVIMRDSEVVGEKGYGKYIPRNAPLTDSESH